MTDIGPLRWRAEGFAAALRWQVNHRFLRYPGLLNLASARLSVVDVFGAPGDTLLTAIVCRHLRQRFPRLHLNFLTPNPELLAHDPNIDRLNDPEGYLSVWSWYPNLIGSRNPHANLLSETFERLGWAKSPIDYRARVYLTPEERSRGRQSTGEPGLPVLTFNTRTKEPTKNWPLDAWRAALAELRRRFHLVHLGDANEPELEGVQRFAGKLSMRESMGVLSCARAHVGGVSFLMHAANGLDVPSVVIYGGRETPANSGYASNVNLYSAVPCSPCWLHDAHGERCGHNMICMAGITVRDVVAAVNRVANRVKNA